MLVLTIDATSHAQAVAHRFVAPRASAAGGTGAAGAATPLPDAFDFFQVRARAGARHTANARPELAPLAQQAPSCKKTPRLQGMCGVGSVWRAMPACMTRHDAAGAAYRLAFATAGPDRAARSSRPLVRWPIATASSPAGRSASTSQPRSRSDAWERRTRPSRWTLLRARAMHALRDELEALKTHGPVAHAHVDCMLAGVQSVHHWVLAPGGRGHHEIPGTSLSAVLRLARAR
jgi:hypothetical protein